VTTNQKRRGAVAVVGGSLTVWLGGWCNVVWGQEKADGREGSGGASELRLLNQKDFEEVRRQRCMAFFLPSPH
jgi:hypothetical protein